MRHIRHKHLHAEADPLEQLGADAMCLVTGMVVLGQCDQQQAVCT